MARKKNTRKKSSRTTSGRKKTSRAAASRKKAAAKAPAKISSTDRPRTKSDFFKTIAENTELSKQQVASVFDVAQDIVAKDLSARGPGVVNFGGLMKVVVQKKPATKARKGVNPFTGEEMMFKAKPARKVVKVRPLKALKELV